MNKTEVYVFLADGFEEIEGLTVVDLLRRAGISTSTVSIQESVQVEGSHGITVTADTIFAENDYLDAEFLVLPGGMPGTTHLNEYQPLKTLLLQHAEQGKKVAAICAAPTVLSNLGLLRGHRATSYPARLHELDCAEACEEKVVVDGTITTSRGLGTAIDFSLSLISQLRGAEKAREIADSIVFF